MKKYTIEFRGSAQVEADSPDEAEDKFFNEEYEEITITSELVTEK